MGVNLKPTFIAMNNVTTTVNLQTQWFQEFIATLQTHQLMLETNTASEELKNIYNVFFNGSETELAHAAKRSSDIHFIKSIIVDYLKEIKQNMPVKLAFDLDDSEVLVWAEINNDDEATEDFLLLAEAAVNAKFHAYGYDITSTIVEKRDSLAVPNHYIIYKA